MTVVLGRELAALFNGALHPVLALRAGRLTYGNPAFQQWLGHDNFRGQALWELAHPETRQDLQALMLAGRCPGELTLRFADGRTADATCMELSLHDEVVRVVRFRELPEAQGHVDVPEELPSVDRPLWDLLKTSRVGFWLVDDRGRTILCNPPAAELLGTTVESLQNSTLFDRLPVEGSGLPDGIHHLPVQHADGSTVHVEACFSPFRDEHGQVAGVLALLRDVSAQRQMLDEMERSETRLRALVETAPCAICLLNTRGTIYEINAAAERMFGFSRSEWLRGDVVVDALYAVPGERRRVVNLTRDEGTVLNHAVVMRRRDGSTFPALLGATLFVDGDEERFAVAVVDASTAGDAQLHELQGQLHRHRTDLERMVASFNAHLQAPLVTLSGFLQALVREGPAADGGRAILDRLQQTSRRAARLLSDLGGYTSLLHPTPKERVPLATLVRGALVDTCEAVEATGAQVEVAEGLPVILCNPNCVQAALAHLINNAVRFGRPGAPPHVRVHAQEQDGTCVVRVEDDGLGVPDAAWDRLFELFGTSGTQPGEGAGLGLAYVRRVAENHNGRAWLEKSSLGGTCACLQLPLEG